MKLYYMPGVCSLAPHIALAETGASYSLVKVDLYKRQIEGGANFDAFASKGKVPILIMANGEALTENATILIYVADLQGKLVPPASSPERLRVQEWLTFITTELHKGFSPLFNPAMPEDAKKLARENVAKQLRYVESRVAEPYLSSAEFTIADAYLYTMLRWARFHKIAVGPKLEAYFDRVGARSAVQKALAEEGLTHAA